MILLDPFYYINAHHPCFHYGDESQLHAQILFGWYQLNLKKEKCVRELILIVLTFVIFNTVLGWVLMLLLLLLQLLLSCDWTWRTKFAHVCGCASWSTFCRIDMLLLSMLVLSCCWLLLPPIKWRMHSVHRTHPHILRCLIHSWLLLTLCSISPRWPYMSTTASSIHYLHWAISKRREDWFRINISLCLILLHLPWNLPSMCHIGQAVGVPNDHTVIVAQHVSMIDLVLVMSIPQHLCWSALLPHSFGWNGSLLVSVYLARSGSLILLYLEMWTTSRSWSVQWLIHLIGSTNSCVDGTNMAVTLLLLLRSRARSIVCRRVWRWWCFLLASTHLIWVTRVFSISCSFGVTSSEA